MTRDDAITVVQMIINNWTRPEWTEAQMEAFIRGLINYDAELATQAVALAHKELSFKPSFAEWLSFYRAAKADAASRQQRPPEPKRDKNKMPIWVRRWVVSRLMYERFGKDQDMRRFPEQEEWADPTIPLMPADAWMKEAAAIGDREAMAAIQGQK